MPRLHYPLRCPAGDRTGYCSTPAALPAALPHWCQDSLPVIPMYYPGCITCCITPLVSGRSTSNSDALLRWATLAALPRCTTQLHCTTCVRMVCLQSRCRTPAALPDLLPVMPLRNPAALTPLHYPVALTCCIIPSVSGQSAGKPTLLPWLHYPVHSPTGDAMNHKQIMISAGRSHK